MYLNPEIKSEIFGKYSHSAVATDTGSPESQIALFTYRINHLTDHLKTHKKDVSTRTGLLRLVGKRRRLLNYLQKNDIERYRAVIKELGIRK
jgi:small subunit ribosomal protein S15